MPITARRTARFGGKRSCRWRGILSGLSQGLASWFEGASLSVDINRVTALAEERQMLWQMAARADFLDPAEKRAMVGLS